MILSDKNKKDILSEASCLVNSGYISDMQACLDGERLTAQMAADGILDCMEGVDFPYETKAEQNAVDKLLVDFFSNYIG